MLGQWGLFYMLGMHGPQSRWPHHVDQVLPAAPQGGVIARPLALLGAPFKAKHKEPWDQTASRSDPAALHPEILRP